MAESGFFPMVFGVVLCVLGMLNMRGDISSVHRYHRHRVTDENRKPFGKLVGFGTLLIGGSMVVFGILALAAEGTGDPRFLLAGAVLLIVSIAAGLGISLYAMMKYNHGIF